MTYNLSFMDNTTGLFQIVEGVNTASDGWLAGLFLIVTWVLIFMVFQQKTDTTGLLLGSSFIMAIVTGLFFFMGLIPSWVLIIPVLGIIVGIMAKYMA
jgi:hypothetical protein